MINENSKFLNTVTKAVLSMSCTVELFSLDSSAVITKAR